jgi:hypothetical protein
MTRRKISVKGLAGLGYLPNSGLPVRNLSGIGGVLGPDTLCNYLW